MPPAPERADAASRRIAGAGKAWRGGNARTRATTASVANGAKLPPAASDRGSGRKEGAPTRSAGTEEIPELSGLRKACRIGSSAMRVGAGRTGETDSRGGPDAETRLGEGKSKRPSFRWRNFGYSGARSGPQIRRMRNADVRIGGSVCRSSAAGRERDWRERNAGCVLLRGSGKMPDLSGAGDLRTCPSSAVDASAASFRGGRRGQASHDRAVRRRAAG